MSGSMGLETSSSRIYAIIGSRHTTLPTATPPAFAMTLRVTPEILASVEAGNGQEAKLSVKLGRSQNVLTINGVTHALKSHQETPSMCESYVEDNGRFFQVAGIHKKLIVQRNLAQHPDPTRKTELKPTSERTRSLDKDHSKKRRHNSSSLRNLSANVSRKSLPQTPSPSISRAHHSSPSYKIPTSSTTYHSEARRPSSTSSSTNQGGLSPVQRPELSRPESMINKPNLTSKRKNSRSNSNSAASSNENFSINKDMTLEQQLVHILAPAPMTISRVSKLLGISAKKLHGPIKKVADLEFPGQYVLKQEFRASVSLEKWKYSQVDKAKLIQLESECAIKSFSPPATVKTSESSGEDAIISEVDAELIIERLSMLGPISTDEEHQHCANIFMESYQVYCHVDERLKQVQEIFANHNTQLNCASNNSERKKIGAQIQTSYNDIYREFEHLNVVYEKLHVSVARVKQLCNDYASREP